MPTGSAEPARLAGLASQLIRFAVVGATTVGIDFLVYQGLLALGVWVHAAKAISFIVATIVAYALNRRWTFGSRGGAARAAGFTLLYGTTFFVNVGMNALALHLLPEFRWEVVAAFLIAQATSTTINFIVMRTVIFRS